MISRFLDKIGVAFTASNRHKFVTINEARLVIFVQISVNLFCTCHKLFFGLCGSICWVSEQIRKHHVTETNDRTMFSVERNGTIPSNQKVSGFLVFYPTL